MATEPAPQPAAATGDAAATLAARVHELECRLAFQDDTIDRLNEVVRAQWEAIQRLERQAAELAAQLRDIERREPGAPQVPPPHY